MNIEKDKKITRDIICIGASSGGVEALKDLVKGLPKNFNGSVFIVLHIPSYSETRLPSILTKAGPLKAELALDGEIIERGRIYVAPNDHHLLIQDDKVVVRRGPKENSFRPAIDALFRSAAYGFKSRVIGIILSGYLDDGVSGLWTIQQLGGISIVQDPDTAEQPQLPENVLHYMTPDYTIGAADMGPIISGLIHEPAPDKNKFSEEQLKLLKTEVVIATRDNAFEMGIMNMGKLTPFTCPECSGSLVRLVESDILRFRCHTGHAYTASSLAAEVTESVETNLWKSMRALEETNMLMNNIADQYKKMHNQHDAVLFKSKANAAANKAKIIHDIIFEHTQFSEDIRLNKQEATHSE